MLEVFLMTLFGGLWRFIKGRDWKYKNWHIVLAAVLLPYCYLNWGVDGFVMAIAVHVNLAAGFDSFTLPWLPYKLKVLWLNARLYLLDLMPVNRYFYLGTRRSILSSLDRLHFNFESKNGWNSWHTVYRFLPLLLLGFSSESDTGLFVYLGLMAVAGFMFPFTTCLKNKGYIDRYPHEVNEIILGACAIGGLPLLKGF